MKVLYISSKHLKQSEIVRNVLNLEAFATCAVIQKTFGHGPKALYVKWSEGPVCGHCHSAATETSLLA